MRFGGGCSALYAVTAGIVFNVTQKTSVPFVPIAPASPPPTVRRISVADTRLIFLFHAVPLCKFAPLHVHLALPAPQDELNKTAKLVIIVVVVVIGTLFLCMCGALYYMYRRERQGEPVFSKLEEARDVIRCRPSPGVSSNRKLSRATIGAGASLRTQHRGC